MLKVKEIEMTLSLDDMVLPLTFQDKTETGGGETYYFYNEKRKISAQVRIEEENGITAGIVKVSIENHPFRESFNLQENAPVRIFVAFEEVPSGICAAYQHRDWWSRPAFISSFAEMPERTQSLFVRGKESFGYILPMVGRKTKTYISKGTDTALSFEMTAYTEGLNQLEDTCFLLSEGSDLYELTRWVMQKACLLQKIPVKAGRKYPEMFEYLGWCSWDAFYTDITEAKVEEKVRELQEKQIPVRWLLMDDGWLSTKAQCLTDFGPDPEKFPEGFQNLTDRIKKETMIKWIGVWHALGGYWGGIAPASALALDQKEHLYRTKNGKLLPHFEPEKGFGFWRAWYTYLRDQGIDFVKVDGQSALKNYYKHNEEIGKAAGGTHQALEAAVGLLMSGNIINCMGMAMENILNRPATCVSRNSDDFVPQEADGFREHLLQNAYNALYHDEVYVCDWDMFWTGHPDAKKHALIRAISGGPIYVSDRIEESVREELLPLIYHDGRILRMDRCAKPTQDCIFDSPLENRALKLTNTVRNTGAMAAFHISESNEAIETSLSPSEIHDLSGETFGAYRYFDKTFTVVRKEEAIPVTLGEKEYTLVLFVPLFEAVTPIGLINKYMSAHAVKSVREEKGRTVITLEEGGIFAFHMQGSPKQVLVNGREVTGQLKAENGYYSIDLSAWLEEAVVSIC